MALYTLISPIALIPLYSVTSAVDDLQRGCDPLSVTPSLALSLFSSPSLFFLTENELKTCDLAVGFAGK